MPPKDDADRFARIRDKQIAARDPMVKVRKLDHTVSEKHRRHRTSFSLVRMWLDIPKVWRGTIIGGLLGLLVMLVVPTFVPGDWGTLGGLAALGFLLLLGFSLGRYQDSRDEIKDLMKH
jgi:uncharacterized membrane protein